LGHLTDNSGKAGDPAKGKVVWEFEKIDSYNQILIVIVPYSAAVRQNGFLISFMMKE
jgi:hypothetical protein